MQKHYNYLDIDLDSKNYRKLRAMQGDIKSRYILVNLYSNNLAYDLSHCTVKIYGLKRDKTIFFNNAVVKNAKLGQFEIELTNQALAVPGELKVQILVLGTDGEKLTSSAFFIDVGESIIDENAIESTNEFGALTESLTKVNEWNGYFEETSGKIEEKYTERLNNVDSQLEQKTSELDSKINTLELEKANLNDLNSKVWSMANMGQDIKEAMTGGSVAVVDKNTILETNIVDKQVTKRKTSFYNKSLNLENKDLQVVGKGILTNNGELYDNPDLTSTVEYIEISCFYISLEKFDSDGISNGSNETMGIAFYDINKSFIKFSDVQVNTYIEIPSNAKYIRYQIMSNLKGFDFNLYPTKELQGKYVEQYVFEESEKINKTVESLKDGSFLKDGIIEPIKTSFFNIYENLFNTSKVVIGAILKENGILEQSFNEWRATNWIEVKSGTTIYFSNDGEPYTTHLGALYNVNKQYLSPIQDTNKVKVIEDGYMRVSQNGGFPLKYQIEVGQVTEYKDFNKPKSVLDNNYLDIKINNNFENKKYLLLGDSITALGNNEYGWEYHFRKIVNPSNVVNIAVNGCTWKDYSDTPAYDGNPIPENHLNVIGNQVQKVINQKASGNLDYTDFDVVIIACGTNDPFDRNTETKDTVENEFITSYSTGNYTVKPINEVDRKTFAGAMRYAYEKLYELYPNAVFFVTTPLQEVYENYLDIKAKGDLIDYIADRLSINTINTRRCGILNTYESPVGDIDYDNPTGSESTRKRDLSDGIHTNPSGAKKLGEFNAREIIKYFCF